MKASETEIKSQIRSFITGNFLLGRSDTSLNEGDSFLELGIVDSTGVLELVGFVQETWSVKVEDEELLPENFDSIRNLSAFVHRKLS
jgi:acyl carrier protein